MTGSTVYSAIGQDSIKAEQRHFDEVIREKPIQKRNSIR